MAPTERCSSCNQVMYARSEKYYTEYRGNIWRDIIAPLYPESQADSGAFVARLARAVIPTRGWAATLNDLYWEIGTSFQVPTYWRDPELASCFPLPRPNFH